MILSIHNESAPFKNDERNYVENENGEWKIIKKNIDKIQKYRIKKC